MCFGFFVVGSAFASQVSLYVLRETYVSQRIVSQFGLCNAYFALLPRPMTWTGILHRVYGLGAFASPLVATSMVTKGIPVRASDDLTISVLTHLLVPPILYHQRWLEHRCLGVGVDRIS